MDFFFLYLAVCVPLLVVVDAKIVCRCVEYVCGFEVTNNLVNIIRGILQAKQVK